MALNVTGWSLVVFNEKVRLKSASGLVNPKKIITDKPAITSKRIPVLNQAPFFKPFVLTHVRNTISEMATNFTLKSLNG
jgi:hypothetical protein